MSQTEKVQKVESQIIFRKDASSFSVIGDPGCEGLGTSMMKVYANALQAAAQDDFILVAGDLVPVGTGLHYRAICELTNAASPRDVYALRGNHDTGAYEDYFGRQNYVILCESFTIVVIDNAKRTFEEEGLLLLEQILMLEDCQNIVVAFHIPLPNHYTGNSVSAMEFERLKEIYRPYKKKIKYFVCGHVHSRFVDEVDGVPLICTGGGGAMIEDVSDDIRAQDVDHHIVRFVHNGEVLNYQFVDLINLPYRKERSDALLKEKLAETVKGELYAHLRYLTFAERAEKRGMKKVGSLFRAMAESEYRHARNFFSILDHPGAFAESISKFIPGEEFEYQRFYPMMEEYAKENSFPLAQHAYSDASAAEKVHAALLEKAERGEPVLPSRLYVCPVCGFIGVQAQEELGRCPVCGAPSAQFLYYDL